MTLHTPTSKKGTNFAKLFFGVIFFKLCLATCSVVFCDMVESGWFQSAIGIEMENNPITSGAEEKLGEFHAHEYARPIILGLKVRPPITHSMRKAYHSDFLAQIPKCCPAVPTPPPNA